MPAATSTARTRTTACSCSGPTTTAAPPVAERGRAGAGTTGPGPAGASGRQQRLPVLGVHPRAGDEPPRALVPRPPLLGHERAAEVGLRHPAAHGPPGERGPAGLGQDVL